MKHLNKLFAFDDRPSTKQQPASTPRLTSTLYAVTFLAESKQSSNCGTSPSAGDKFDHKSGVTILAHSASCADADCCLDFACGDRTLNHYSEISYSSPRTTTTNSTIRIERSRRQRVSSQEPIREASSLGGYLLTATIGKTIASTSALATPDTIADQLIEEDDWILIEASSQPPICRGNHNKQLEPNIIQQSQMALDLTDIELIKASWEPVRNDPGASGLLLFKG